MPAFLDFHSMGRYTEDDLKKSQKEPRDQFGGKILNVFYEVDSGMIFCLLDAPDRYAVECGNLFFCIISGQRCSTPKIN